MITVNLVTMSPYKYITLLLTIFPILSISFPWFIYFVTGNLYLLISLTYFTHPPPLLPSGNHLFVLCIYDSVLFCYVCSLILCFRFHMSVKSYGICLSLSNSFHLAWYPMGPSMLWQMERFHPSLQMSDIPLCMCVYIYHIFLSHSSVRGHLGYFHIFAIVNNASVNIICI